MISEAELIEIEKRVEALAEIVEIVLEAIAEGLRSTRDCTVGLALVDGQMELIANDIERLVEELRHAMAVAA